jgi:ribonuclease T1
VAQTGRSKVMGALGKLALSFSTVAAATVFALASPAAVACDQAHSSRVLVAELPAEARQVRQLILAGGPFAYDKDGSVFGNRERLLPNERRGYYREYTVRTPGARDRGARRIVCGGARPTAPEACYYTDNHYASFRRIVQ